MKSSSRLLFAVLFTSIALVLIAAPSRGQDPVKTNPGKYKVVFENERVRLLEYNDKPGDVSVMHEHPAHLIYSLGPWKRQFIFPDGRTVRAEGKVGDSFWADAQKHAGENVGATDTHILIFELKELPKK